MKRINFLIAFLITAVIAQAQKIYDANATLRTVGEFKAISVSNAFSVYISQSNETGLAVSAENKNDIKNIVTEVEDGVLKIRYDEKGSWRGDKKLKAYISFKDLNRIIMKGATDLYIVTPVNLPSLQVDASGASNFKTLTGVLNIDDMVIKSQGASDIQLKGKVNKLVIDASGASDIKSYALVANTCDIKASGASDIKLTVNGELTVNASGASDIRYKGSATVSDIKSTGASSVSKVND